MKKEYMASVIGGLVVAVAVTLMLTLSLPPTTQATNTTGRDITDHALMGPDTDQAVGCKSDKSFNVFITMRAVNATTLSVFFMNDTFGTPDDTLAFPLSAGEVVNIAQAAGGTPDVDTHLVVSGTNVGDLSGWISIVTQTGAAGFDGADVDYCRSYTAVADAQADD